MDTRNFEVLYTHQKQKKNKTWQDGCLKVSCNGTKAVLYNDGKTSLEIFHIQPNKVFSGSDVECDRYLINIGDEQKVEAKGKHCLERSLIIPAENDLKTRDKHVHAVETESSDSSLNKRKRRHFTTTGNFHHNDKFEKTMSGCKIFRENSHHGGLANPRKSILEEPSWGIENNTMEPKKDYLKNDYERVVASSAPAQKRNKKELLSLFSHKPLIDPTLCEGMTTNWNALNQEEYCFKNLNSSNMPHKFQYQNTKESGWRINDGELRSPQISGYGQRVFSDHNESNPPIEHSAYLGSNINIFEGLDCSLDDSGDFGDHTFFDMVKPTISATNRESLPAASKCNSNVKLFFSDSQVVDTDDSALETMDFELDVNDEILFDICPRFETSDTFSCETKQNTRTVETPSVHDIQTGNYVSGSNKGFLAKNIMERGPLNCEKRTPMSFKSHSFTPPVLPSVVPESNSLLRDKFLAPKDSTLATTSTQGCHARVHLQLSFSGELHFPSKEHCSGSVTPTREVVIPIKFTSVMEYKQILKSALREHLNIILFELAQTYHGILTKVDIVSSSDPLSGQKENIKGPSCSHGLARLRAVKKDGPNKGRHFYCCPSSGSDQCKFFKWADECCKEFSTENKKLPLTSSDSIRVYFRSNGVHFYHDCLFERRIHMPYAKRYSGKKHSRGGQRHSDLNNHKKSMYIVLKYRESSSSYSKDDIWIVSKTLNFEPHSTFVAKSLFYGPSSSGDLEIEPVSGYSPSNWKSGDTVHAVWACNAGNELSCIKNMDDHVTSQQMPLLPYVLNGSQPSHSSSRAQRFTFTAPLTSDIDRNSLGVTWSVIEEETEKMVIEYKLNEDQAAAIYSCAKMFISPVEGSQCPPITLIHGVFGAGKSFLLSVVVLLMVRLFEISDASDEARSSTNDWKILISSTTNVAVDRVLVGLLDLGFEQFVRVGSLRKIAKPVLPFSIHSAGSESQELKELQTMLKSDLTTSEKAYVRKSIERQKLGENRKRLSNVRVVGVTCAACVFPSLERLKFPVLLLDECSQMTEPASLLPMARFGCRKLVLVGDPKQLNPTIQGSEPKHETGLEQTLFDRLIKMNLEPILLRTQYRCHPRISSIANRLFYGDNLLDGVTSDERQPLVDYLPTLCFYNVSKGREQCSQDGSYFNQSEANFIVVLIKSLLESQVNPTQIGVITQYKSQLTTIANSLMSDGETSNKELKGVQISTVDAFQGGEKDVIILSCVRTQHVGFIDCKRRTNVAVTRAKRHLCIVGCGRMLSSNSLWGKIITYCQETPNGVQCSGTFIRQWNETRPALSEGSSNKSTREKKIKTKTRNTKVKPTAVTVQHESNFSSSKDPNVSIDHVRLQTEPKQTLTSDNNTINDDEIQEIVPDTVCSQDNTVVLIEDKNDGLPAEFEFFNSLMEDDLSDYSSLIDA